MCGGDIGLMDQSADDLAHKLDLYPPNLLCQLAVVHRLRAAWSTVRTPDQAELCW